MSENQLSEEQRDKIEKIKDQWLKELEEIEANEAPWDGKTLDGPGTWERAKLEKKYRAMLQEVKNQKKIK